MIKSAVNDSFSHTKFPQVAPGIHVDTAVLYNNIGVCLDTLDPLFRNESALQCFATAHAVFTVQIY